MGGFPLKDKKTLTVVGIGVSSRDEGKSWKKVAEGLPQVLCVKAAVVQMDGVPPPKSKLVKKQKAGNANRISRSQ